ncbi:MAG: GTP-sensing pleiotropic transcriptional regulator CodY [Bacillota bacterium]
MEDNRLVNQIKQLSRLFHQSDHEETALKEGTREIADITGAAALVIDKDGGVLAYAPGKEKLDGRMESLVEQGTLAGDSGLMALLDTQESLFNQPYPEGSSAGGSEGTGTAVKGKHVIVVPIQSGKKKMASLLLYKESQPFEQNHWILAEVGAALLGMILVHEFVDQEEQEARNKKLAAAAFESLSYSEVEAIHEILKSINNNESIVVASKIADGLGITRSVIVNALRKFESAGIIESRSLGMKGTLIRVKNPYALEMIASRSADLDSIS